MTPTKTIDVLEQDPEIRGQKFACLSFISPEDVLMSKEVFLLNNFLSFFASEMSELFSNMLEYFKDNASTIESINLIKSRYDYIYSDTGLQKEFEFYKDQNHDSLESKFLERNEFKTSVRGIKVRGSYDTLDEAKARVEQIRKFDDKFNVYVAQIGCWCPWSPSPSVLEDQEYAETSLNSLVKSYIESEELKKDVYKDRKEDMIDKIRKEMEQRKDLWMAAKEKENAEKGQKEVSSDDVEAPLQEEKPDDVEVLLQEEEGVKKPDDVEVSV